MPQGPCDLTPCSSGTWPSRTPRPPSDVFLVKAPLGWRGAGCRGRAARGCPVDGWLLRRAWGRPRPFNRGLLSPFLTEMVKFRTAPPRSDPTHSNSALAAPQTGDPKTVLQPL